ncbi:DegT/DnrJ/EryC1/StrS family aminotransferase [Candidatus Microgenomates bacterium]|nr:DegT/DnrJ/EryC1/StrS family aminotransferase [Candidatus Microgenomates bacterium]
MISTDFAPNETRADASLSLSLLAKSKNWYVGPQADEVAGRLVAYLPGHQFTMYLTARAGLYNYLKALNLPPKSHVLVTGFTCEAVVIPVKALELVPVFVDIDRETFSMDVAQVKKHISEHTRLIILQHTFGIPPHRKEIIALAKESGIPVIEDLAHGFDEQMFRKDSYETDKLFSFGRSKVMSSVYGGAVATHNTKLHLRLTHMQDDIPYPKNAFLIKCLLYKPIHMLVKSTYDSGLGKALHFISNKLDVFPKELSKIERMLGMDAYVLKKYPNALAHLLSAQLDRFDEVQEARRITTNYYADSQGIALHNLPLGRFPLLVKNRDELRSKLAKKNIFLGRWYNYVLAKPGERPVAEEVSRHIINLPTLVPIKDAERVINEIDTSLIV